MVRSIKCQKYFGLRNGTNDVMTPLVRSSGLPVEPSTREKGPSSASETDAPAPGAEFCHPLTPAFLKRQRNGCASVGEPNYAPIPNDDVPQALEFVVLPISANRSYLAYEKPRRDTCEWFHHLLCSSIMYSKIVFANANSLNYTLLSPISHTHHVASFFNLNPPSP